MSGSSRRARRPLPTSHKQPVPPEPNGSAKVRNWVLAVGAILAVLGGAFGWFESSFDALDRRMDTFGERLARIEAQLDILIGNRPTPGD